MRFRLIVEVKDRATLDAILNKCVKGCFKRATVVSTVPVGEYVVDDYRAALAGVGPLAAVWDATPRKLVFDLCDKLEEQK
jgi:hypothetical protein